MSAPGVAAERGGVGTGRDVDPETVATERLVTCEIM